MKKLSRVFILLLAVVLSAGPVQAQEPAEGQSYTVQAGDWLSKIAEKYYGDPLAYPAIVEGTNGKAAEDASFAMIDNPDVIEVGQKLWIPGEAEASVVGAEPAAEAESAMNNNILPAGIVAQLDAFLQSQVYADGGTPSLAAPGLILYVQTPDGVYLNSAGVANLADGTPLDRQGRLEIGSNTKSMTIVLLMQLVEAGLISLDDPLSQYLPDQAALFENGDRITIRQLAQHTAGLYDYGDNIILAGVSDPGAMEAAFTPAQLVQNAAAEAPYFAPGEADQWHYSNTGYILIGMIIESLTGEKMADLYQSRIFDPLGLDSALFLDDVPQAGDLDAHGYWWTGAGDIVDTTTWNGSQGWVAGSVIMSAEDLATYGKALAAGQLFQNPETLPEMLTWDQAALANVGGPYGLGLFDFAGDGSVWGHAGQTLGFQSLWYIDPARQIVVAGLTNSATYEAFAFLNVHNILIGETAQPLNAATLLPFGSLAPTAWILAQVVTPLETTDFTTADGLIITLGKDKRVAVVGGDCGTAIGSYTTPAPGQIDFEIDPSGMTCEADAVAMQLVQYLNDAANWHVANGQLFVELPADAGTLMFN